MVELWGIALLAVVTICFGFLAGFQMAHINYNRKLVRLVKRCVNSGTIAPILVALEDYNNKHRKEK